MSSWKSVARIFLPDFLRKYVRDKVEYVKRIVPGKHMGNQKYDLRHTQVYPKGSNFYSVLEDVTKEKLSSVEISLDTPVSSIGTCFAEEFAYFMRDNGYNYIYTEGDKLAASANWGRVYTVPNLLQIVQYSINDGYPLVIEQSERGWFDPLREAHPPYYSDKNTAEEAIKEHRRASYYALTKCEILIVTVGQNEAWKDSKNDIIWARIPPSSILNKSKQNYTAKEFSYTENISALKEVVNLLQIANPGIKIIFTVSPVASYASFSDIDVVSNSFANKCILRAVVNELIATQPDKLFYFPSFEMVLCDNPRNFRADNRHVKYSSVKRIFSLLSRSISID